MSEDQEIGIGDKVRHVGKGSAIEGVVLIINGEKCDLKIQGGVAYGMLLRDLEVVEKAPEIIEEEDATLTEYDHEEAEKAEVDNAIKEATNFVPEEEPITIGKMVKNVFKKIINN